MKTNIEEEIFKLKANVEEHEEQSVKNTLSRILCKMFCADLPKFEPLVHHEVKK